jgi:hypothetical protein
VNNMKLSESKFKIGDEVYLISKTYDKHIHEKCHACNGQGEVYRSIISSDNVNYEPFKCDKCKGSGEIGRWSESYKIMDNSCVITGINYKPTCDQWDTYLDREDYEYIYNVSEVYLNGWNDEYLENPDKYKESEIFLNKEDAQVECSKRNLKKNDEG